jgi:branched-chain amino acid transport system substrate-binding protein
MREHYRGEIVQVRPFPKQEGTLYESFVSAYRARWGMEPTASAAYTYDAVTLVARSIRESGLNRSGLRDAIAGSSGSGGVTGPISWDNAGGNDVLPVLTRVPDRH